MAGSPDFKFDLSIFEQEGDDRLTMNGMTVFAGNIQIDGYPCLGEPDDFQYPVYFEVGGRAYHYILSALHDMIEIEVCNPKTFERLSVCTPRNQSELLEAISSIARDFEDWLDKQAVA